MRGAAAARSPFPAVLALGIIPVLFHFVIVETSHIRLALALHPATLFKLGFVTVSALMHWAIYASLLLSFSVTLWPGREPLITTMVRKLHGAMPDELKRYTRHVTIAWCCFFATQLAASVTLFCLAPLVVWSFFVNILDLPLVAAMFSAEYIIRLRVLKNPPRESLSAIVSMIAGTTVHARTRPAASHAQPD